MVPSQGASRSHCPLPAWQAIADGYHQIPGRHQTKRGFRSISIPGHNDDSQPARPGAGCSANAACASKIVWLRPMTAKLPGGSHATAESDEFACPAHQRLPFPPRWSLGPTGGTIMPDGMITKPAWRLTHPEVPGYTALIQTRRGWYGGKAGCGVEFATVAG